MKHAWLIHPLSSPELQRLGASLDTLLSDANSDEGVQVYRDIQQLVDQRRDAIQLHLDSLDDNQRKQFAKAEIEVNKKLQAIIEPLFDRAKSDAVRYISGRKAVNKYK